MAECNKLNEEIEKLELEDKNRQDRIKEIRAYVEVLRKIGNAGSGRAGKSNNHYLKDFSEELFAMLVDKVSISENEIKIRWRDGRES